MLNAHASSVFCPFVFCGECREVREKEHIAKARAWLFSIHLLLCGWYGLSVQRKEHNKQVNFSPFSG